MYATTDNDTNLREPLIDQESQVEMGEEELEVMNEKKIPQFLCGVFAGIVYQVFVNTVFFLRYSKFSNHFDGPDNLDSNLSQILDFVLRYDLDLLFMCVVSCCGFFYLCSFLLKNCNFGRDYAIIHSNDCGEYFLALGYMTGGCAVYIIFDIILGIYNTLFVNAAFCLACLVCLRRGVQL